MNTTNPGVDQFFAKPQNWRGELEILRSILLSFELTEELKWGKPCYTLKESNIVILQGFKESCAILFAKGALLQDSLGILEKPGENTHGARRVRFTSVQAIVELEPVLKQYIQEAIAAEKAGLKVDWERKPAPIPEELQSRLDEDRPFQQGWASLTPGRQRAYLLFFSAAKQSRTREARVEKCRPQILLGKGLNDLDRRGR